MKIISNFKDYYDHSLGYVDSEGEDVYSRFTIKETVRGDVCSLPLVNALDGNFFKVSVLDRLYNIDEGTLHPNSLGFNCHPAFLIVCGVLYPVIIWYRGEKVIDAFYTKEKYLAARVKYRKEFCTNKEEPQSRWKWDDNNIEKKVNRFFSVYSDERLVEYCIENKIVIGLIQQKRKHTEYYLTKNPNLDDLKFQRVMDGHLLYQEINMFLGRICSPENNMVEISEKDRINQHGFDKYSFRKMPEKK